MITTSVSRPFALAAAGGGAAASWTRATRAEQRLLQVQAGVAGDTGRAHGRVRGCGGAAPAGNVTRGASCLGVGLGLVVWASISAMTLLPV